MVISCRATSSGKQLGFSVASPALRDRAVLLINAHCAAIEMARCVRGRTTAVRFVARERPSGFNLLPCACFLNPLLLDVSARLASCAYVHVESVSFLPRSLWRGRVARLEDAEADAEPLAGETTTAPNKMNPRMRKVRERCVGLLTAWAFFLLVFCDIRCRMSRVDSGALLPPRPPCAAGNSSGSCSSRQSHRGASWFCTSPF
jgi:hypothetical protein